MVGKCDITGQQIGTEEDLPAEQQAVKHARSTHSIHMHKAKTLYFSKRTSQNTVFPTPDPNECSECVQDTVINAV